jgi:hypothetical protein
VASVKDLIVVIIDLCYDEYAWLLVEQELWRWGTRALKDVPYYISSLVLIVHLW